MPGPHASDEPYPANDQTVTARTIMLDGERVRIVESGRADAFPVVLLHGWGASAYNFRDILPALGAAGFRAIAPDLRGHGWSETRVPAGAWSATAIADWVRQLLDALGADRCVLVGQSIGGAVAMDAASLMPGRVAGLVLLAPIGFTHVRRVVLARRLGLRYWRPSAPRWVVSWVVRRIYGRRRRWQEQDIDEYWVPLRRRDVVGALLQSVREFDFEPRDPEHLALGDCRMIIRFGELDGLIPHRVATLHARRFQNADVAVFGGVGHVPAEEVPEEVTELIVSVALQARGQSSELRTPTSTSGP